MEHNTTEEEQQDYTRFVKQIPVEQYNDPAFLNRSPDDEQPSLGGHGTLEILEVTQILHGAGITCCLVGISALIYYGAGRGRRDWEVCVPTEKLREASALLDSVNTYETYPPRPPPPTCVVRKAMCFTLIPSDDAHIDCIPPNIEFSQMGLPYPTLEIFAQSLLDTNDMVALTDLIDGMDLTEQWGLEHLKLDAENDLAWTRRKNEKIRASVPLSPDSCLLELGTNTINLKETWNATVRTKERRIGAEFAEGYWATRFRGRGSADPRSTERYHA
ncbi:uncharacterized protein K460DRAFT_388672 [Cucurbitaria berberidis CBS 394.84]|uniref:Uncharacterized protein n=1 Tax=Cucurbitaria berberidis CBS 394.84 TaxID=1168544 RepID=A0A9P4GAF9_9PLEO|nr:uncharacterized protein K460DRAFT_388672 [Cucurbitaria berberidis CBS 394.84]KAF1841842.1 hypothetical protein K460DRAFT_388672 [Cucurbitaria berberidis CBS 394.84]